MHQGTPGCLKAGQMNVWGCLSKQGWARAGTLPLIFNTSNPNNTFQTPKAIFANRYKSPLNCQRCIETVTNISRDLQLPIHSTYGYSYDCSTPTVAKQCSATTVAIEQLRLVNAWDPAVIESTLAGDLHANRAQTIADLHAVNAADEEGNRLAAGAILAEMVRTGGAVEVGWEHVNIFRLSQYLGLAEADVPYWPGNDFDTVYVFKYKYTHAAGGSLSATKPVLISFEVASQNCVQDYASCRIPDPYARITNQSAHYSTLSGSESEALETAAKPVLDALHLNLANII